MSKPPTPSKESQEMANMFRHMAEHGGGPASPMQMDLGSSTGGEPFVWFSIGMTKRERFSMAAMQGMITNLRSESNVANEATMLADNAVKYADALLERLKK